MSEPIFQQSMGPDMGRVITVDGFTADLLVAPELLQGADRSVLNFDGNELTIKVSNGSARYRYVATQLDGFLSFVLIEGSPLKPSDSPCSAGMGTVEE